VGSGEAVVVIIGLVIGAAPLVAFGLYFIAATAISAASAR
jgi:hypothetical protein